MVSISSFRSLSLIAIHRARGFTLLSILWDNGQVYERHFAVGHWRAVALHPSFKNK